MRSHLSMKKSDVPLKFITACSNVFDLKIRWIVAQAANIISQIRPQKMVSAWQENWFGRLTVLAQCPNQKSATQPFQPEQRMIWKHDLPSLGISLKMIWLKDKIFNRTSQNSILLQTMLYLNVVNFKKVTTKFLCSLFLFCPNHFWILVNSGIQFLQNS